MLAKQAKRNKKNKQPKAKAKAVKLRSAPKAAPTTHDLLRLTHGGHDYIECVLNPRTGPLAKVPYGFPVRSRSLRTKVTGTFTCSSVAGSVAWLCVNPWRMISNSAICATATASGYTGTDTTAMSDASANLSTFSSNSDYNNTSLTGSTTIAYRLVAAELAVSATSSMTSRQGSLFVFTEPSHENLMAQQGNVIDGVTPATVSNYEGCRVRAIPMGNQIERCVWGTPEKPGEVEWISKASLDDEEAYLVAAGLSSAQANAYLSADMGYAPWYGNTMCAVVLGGSSGTSATVCRFEAYAVFEVVGTTITGRTPGCSDPVAFQAASNFIQRTPGSTQLHGTARDALVYLGQQAGYVSKNGDVQYGSLVKDSLSAVAAAAKYLV